MNNECWCYWFNGGEVGDEHVCGEDRPAATLGTPPFDDEQVCLTGDNPPAEEVPS